MPILINNRFQMRNFLGAATTQQAVGVAYSNLAPTPGSLSRIVAYQPAYRANPTSIVRPSGSITSHVIVGQTSP